MSPGSRCWCCWKYRPELLPRDCLAFAKLLTSSHHCLWDWKKQEMTFSLSYHRMQKLSSTVQGFCCLPTKHGLINLDRREREDSEALNQMLQLYLLSKGSVVWTESINSVYGTGRRQILKSWRHSCWEEPLGSAGQVAALTQCRICAVIHGTTWIRTGLHFPSFIPACSPYFQLFALKLQHPNADGKEQV